MRIKVYFDGGCRPNPGRIELAVVMRGQVHVRRDAGHGTSHDAEWLALIEAVRLARGLGAADFVLLGDALAVIGPASGRVKCSRAAAPHLRVLDELFPHRSRANFRYIKRSQNLAGIALANLPGR